jgi:hypothetical protein
MAFHGASTATSVTTFASDFLIFSCVLPEVHLWKGGR